jgi:N-acetylmuramoyl-L-alanine amidase/LGFP repeat
MRVRRASTHARRPSALFVSMTVVSAVAILAAAPDALATRPPIAVPVGSAADGGHAQPARSHSGIRVRSLAVPSVSARDAKVVSDPPKAAATSGRLLAHVRRPSTANFSMLGVTWDHGGASSPVIVEVRTKADGTWSGWVELDTDADGGPVTTKNDASFRDGTEPEWTGSSTGVEVAVYGRGSPPTGLDVSVIDPGPSPSGSLSADTKAGHLTGKPGSFPRIPKIITRKQWGADESLGDECWDPKYGHTFKAVVVHHTAGSNDYRRAESKAIVRGVYAYHTQSRGWCDIGYNFLIDRFGNVFEGRDGGIRRAVRGAHAGDYNVNTTGISLMGNFDLVKPTPAIKQSLVSLIAWRLGTAYHHAYGKPFVFDRPISRISGHRDVMATACPGQYVYDWLPRLRILVNERLGSWSSPIERSWQRAGGKESELGAVRMGELGDDGGHRTVFQHGRMYLSTQGMHTLYAGPILDRYIAWGDITGDLGYPLTNERKVGDGPGRAVFFDHGRIYWSKRTGAQTLRSGAILHKYRMLKAAPGALGFPRTPVIDRNAFTIAHFQGGSIRYDRETQAVSVEYR